MLEEIEEKIMFIKMRAYGFPCFVGEIMVINGKVFLEHVNCCIKIPIDASLNYKFKKISICREVFFWSLFIEFQVMFDMGFE